MVLINMLPVQAALCRQRSCKSSPSNRPCTCLPLLSALHFSAPKTALDLHNLCTSQYILQHNAAVQYILIDTMYSIAEESHQRLLLQKDCLLNLPAPQAPCPLASHQPAM